jgi:hypothetical protein
VVLSASPPSSPSAQVSPLAAAAWGGGTTPPMALPSALNGGDTIGNGSNLTPKNQTDPGRRMEVFSRSSTIAGRLERPSSGGSSIIRGQTATDSSVSASIGSIQTGYSLGVKPGSGVSARLASSIVDNPAEYLSQREEEKEGGVRSSFAPTPAATVAALASGLAGGSGSKRDHNARGGSQASSYGGFGNGTGDNGAAAAMSAGAAEQPTTVKVGPKKPPSSSRGSPSSAYRRIGSGSGDSGGGAETGAASPPDIYKSGLRAVQQQQQQQQQQQKQQQQQQPWAEARRAVGVVDTSTVDGQRGERGTGTADTGAVRTFSSVPSTLTTTTTFTSP